MDSNQFGRLGDKDFELVTTPTSWDYSQSYGWSEHERLEGKPVLQDTSDDSDEIRLSFKVSIPTHKNADQEIKSWSEMGKSKKPLDLTVGTDYKGQFVIKNLRINLIAASSDGTTIAAKIDVALQEYQGLEETEPPLTLASFQRNFLFG